MGPISPEECAQGLRLVFGHLAAEECQAQVERTLELIAGGKVSPQGLFRAHRNEVLVGAVFTQIQPGRTALVWPPRTVAGQPSVTAAKLLEDVCHWLSRQGICVAEVLLPQNASSDESVLLAGGFGHLADLLYLVSLEVDFPAKLPQGPLEFVPYCEADQQRLTTIVEATYEGTLDCPQLDGVRQIEDVLDGYRATGVFHPARWLIVRHGDKDVGCLLLADHPEHGNWELVYMGVVASDRGRGWGMDIVRYAQWLTCRAARTRLVLAVDAANEPAIKVYSTVGFRAWDRRGVYIKMIS
jgi:GNAT superfamily N-acetyltransferase